MSSITTMGKTANGSAPDIFRVVDLVKMSADVAVDALLTRASELCCSDLFFLSEERFVTIAVRRHGAMEKLAVVSSEHGRHMITHIRALAGMDIGDWRRPADGTWVHRFRDRTVDLRINITPTLFGEDLTMRLWDHSTGIVELGRLGLTKSDSNRLLYMLNHPSGLILVTGPTGTGKTTTLYACLKHLSGGSLKINTLEDPIEFALQGARQSQVNPKVGLDFPELLRNVLRQAPDVIMVGEIRDNETATTAVRAANSGHLVLASTHAPTAARAVDSMLALGAHPYFLSSCVLGIVAQRLVRIMCEACRQPMDLTMMSEAFAKVESQMEADQKPVMFGPGRCDECFHTGYVGRTGLFEIMPVNQEIRRLIAESAPNHTVAEAGVRAGMIPFRQAALLKVAQGITSMEEILRDVSAEDLGLED